MRRTLRQGALAPVVVAGVFASIGALLASTAAAAPSPYATRGTCAGYPRVDLKTPPGHCVALLADAGAGLRFPRRLLEVAPGRFWLVDMGSWEPGRGRLLEFVLPAPGRPAAPIVFTTLAEKLDRPLGLVVGPDGRVWLGEAGRISRTTIGAPGAPVRLQTVIDGLPDTGSHPLKEIVFGTGGRLYVNVGSSTDACRDDAGTQAVPCADATGTRPRAAVYEVAFAGPDFTQPSLRPFATGLRNSVALAFVAGPDRLLQGENSIDYADAAAPPEELNALRDGGHYGWPYCTGARTPARGYEGHFDCAATEAPVLLWPAHAAPLHLLAFPATARHAFAGQLLVAWHGYRAGGHRVVSFVLGADGLPHGPAKEWIGGWSAEAGVRPLGAPTGLAVDGAGRLLVVEDRHKTLLMLVREGR
jgi:glucose/arabinose dehydrogenase